MIIRTLDSVYNVISIALFARAILSWVYRGYGDNPIVNFIYSFTEPLLMPMRSLFDRLGLNRSMIDFSFIATIFALQFIYMILRSTLIGLLY